MTVYLSLAGKINLRAFQSLSRACAALVTQHVEDVCLVLHTTGGSVSDGIAAYNMLRAMPFRLTTYNIGRINSIGIVVFLGGAMRYAAPSAAFMFHEVTWTMDTAPRVFSERSFTERLDSIRADQQRIVDIYATHTRLRVDDIRTLIAEEREKDVAFALDIGLIHAIRALEFPQESVIQILGRMTRGEWPKGHAEPTRRLLSPHTDCPQLSQDDDIEQDSLCIGSRGTARRLQTIAARYPIGGRPRQ